MSRKTARPTPSGAEAREARLAEALRRNLKRRKASRTAAPVPPASTDAAD